MKQLTCTLPLLGLTLVLTAPDCNGDAWVYTPQLEIVAGYDDNLRLLPSNDDSGYVSRAELGLGVNRLTAVSRLTGRLGVEFVNYFETEQAGLEDESIQYLLVNGERKLSQRDEIGLGLTYRRDFTGANQRVDQLEVAGEVTDPADVDTDLGLVKRQIRRDRVVFSPYWARNLTESLDLTLNYRFTDVRYERDINLSLVEYDVQTLSSALATRLTAKNTLVVSLDAGKYTPASTARRTGLDNYALHARLKHKLSHISNVGLQVGYRQTHCADPARLDDSESGALYAVDYKRRTESSTLLVVAERRISPSGAGNLLESDKASVSYEAELSPLTQFSLQVRYFDNEAVDSQATLQSQRKLFYIEPELRRNLSRNWSVGFSYRYSSEDRSDGLGDAQSNALYLSLKYTPSFGSDVRP